MTREAQDLPWEPWLAAGTVLAALTIFTTAWILSVVQGGPDLGPDRVGLLGGLVAALILTYHFPVHVEHRSKIYMGSIALLLVACLLPPVVASAAAGSGILAGELSTCRTTGNHLVLPVIPTQIARWIVLVLSASLVAHGPLPFPLSFVGAAIALWAGDILTGPLLLSPFLRRGPIAVVVMMAREGGAVEGVQYVIGLLGAVVAQQQPWALLLLLPPAALVHVAFRRTRELTNETRRLLDATAEMLDRRDPALGEHSRRTAELARAILGELGTTGMEVEIIVTAARLHDIGMLAIPDEIIHKPEGLSPDELALVRRHPEEGAKLVGSISRFARGAAMIRHHHEAWDGSGYPDGLKGTDIPFGARVIAVAECYDALIHDQPDRPAYQPLYAIRIIQIGRGATWDPQVVDALLHVAAPETDQPPTRLRLIRGPDAEM